jgi:hypothetical protein
MATNKEITAEQRRRLFMLLKLKNAKEADKATLLNDLIIETEAEMDAEDVAYVEKKIERIGKP